MSDTQRKGPDAADYTDGATFSDETSGHDSTAEAFADVPAVMKQAQRWLLWKAEPVAGKKPRKVPHYADGTKRLKTDTPEDQAKLVGFDAALAELESGKGYAGLGFALGPDGTGSSWQGIDLDDVADHLGLGLIADDLPGYTEDSPSGKGRHAFGYGRQFPSFNKSKDFGIEAYSSGRYFTITGNLAGMGEPVCLADFVERRLAPITRQKAHESAEKPRDRSTQDSDLIRDLRSALGYLSSDDYDEWIAVGQALKSLGDEGQALWLEWSQASDKWVSNDAKRWDSFAADRTGYQAVFAKAQMAGWVNPGKKGQSKGKTSEHKAESGSSGPKIDLIDPVNGKPKSQATLLIEIGSQYQLIHDADRNAYAIIYRNGAREVWPIRSLGFKHLLAGEFYQLTGKGFNRNAAGDALDTLEAKAIHTGRQHPVYLRVARTEAALYLDLCDEGWRVIEVTAAGWRVLENSPVHFIRKAGMLPLPIPAGVGDLGKLRGLINLDESAGHFELVVGWMLGALRGRSPFPILVLEGEQGTGKSTASRIIRRFVDPSTVALRSPPKDPRDLIVSAVNNHLVCLDNLSGINAEISDCLCRFATGGGLDLRKLYTDVDTVMIDIQRPILCNGIDDICHRPDLAERAIILHLPVLEAPTRVTESKIWEMVDRSSPEIMAGLLDALSAALANEATTHLKHKPRMADFAVWVSASESATPWKSGSFMAAYQAMRGRAVEEGIEASPAGSVLVDYLRSKAPITRWSPTPTHLYEELTRLAGSRANSQAWPRTPRGMGQALKRIAPNLRAIGITFTKDEDHDRLYHFFVSDIVHRAKEAPKAPEAPTEQPEATGDVGCSDSEAWAHRQNPKTRSAHQNGEAPKAPEMRPEQKPSNDGACSDFMGAMGGMGAFSDDCTVRYDDTPPLVDPIAGEALNPATSVEF